MIRRPDWEDDESGYEGDLPPVNGHALQPPLDRVEVRGDVLLMRVAETEEVLDLDNDGGGVEGGGRDYEKEVQDAQGDDEEIAGEKPAAASAKPDGDGEDTKEVRVPTNDEFFLDYTRAEYLSFASRTDVVAPAIFDGLDDDSDGEEAGSDEEGSEGEEGEEADDSDGDFDPSEEVDDEAASVGVMNMILGHLLRKFREENGRGPDSLELLEMRKALADKLGVEVGEVDGEGVRAASEGGGSSPHSPKRVTMADEEGGEGAAPAGAGEDARKRPADGAEEEDGPGAKRTKSDADGAAVEAQ